MGSFVSKNLTDKYNTALKKRDFEKIVDLGGQILKSKPEETQIVLEVFSALKSLNRKEEACEFILSYAKDRIHHGYYDTAILLVKRYLKEEPLSIEAVSLLSEAYEKKELFFDAFSCVKDLLERYRALGNLSPELRTLYLNKLKRLLDTAEEIKSDNVDELLVFFSNLARNILHVDRCSLFISDEDRELLWTKVAHGVDKIEVPWNKGVVGKVFQEKKPLIINDAYASPYFNPSVDAKTGYRTENILTVPVFLPSGRIIGVFQAVNKKKGVFREWDLEVFSFLARYAGKTLVKLESLSVPGFASPDSFKEFVSPFLTFAVKRYLREMTESSKEGTSKILVNAMKGLSLLQEHFPNQTKEGFYLVSFLREVLDNFSENVEYTFNGEEAFVYSDKELLGFLIRSLIEVLKALSESPVQVTIVGFEDLEKKVFLKLDFLIPKGMNESEESDLFSRERAVLDHVNLYVPRQLARYLGGELLVESRSPFTLELILPLEKQMAS